MTNRAFKTGPSPCLVRAVTVEFAPDGADITLLSPDPERLVDARWKIEPLGRRIVTISCRGGA